MSDTTNTAAPEPVIASLFYAAENEVVAGFDDVKDWISGVFVLDVEQFFAGALSLIEQNGGTLLIGAAQTVLHNLGGIIATGSWTTTVTQVLETAKEAGAHTLAETEQLAASTALQVVQAAAGAIGSTAALDPSSQTANS